VSHSDSGELDFDFDDLASAHGRLLSWSDDETTATYEPMHLRVLQQHMEATARPFEAAARSLPQLPEADEFVWLDTGSGRDLAWLWVRTLGAVLGLFVAVLFGRVLLGANTVERHDDGRTPVLRSVNAPVAAEPAAPPSAAAVRAADVTPTPEAEPVSTPAASTTAPRNDRPQSTPAKRWHAARSSNHDDSVAQARAADRELNAALPLHDESRRQSLTTAEPSQATASQSEPAQPGTLRINSRPWSQVFIDGRLVGNTPQREIMITPGSHSVRLVNAEFSMTKTFTLDVSAGESITRVETLDE
jgi:hypothetical protein